MCDASDYAVGAVLGQRKDKKPYVIYYASKTLNSAQMNYTTTEKELLAVVFACDKFRSYLVGSPVVVFSDHAALKYGPDQQIRDSTSHQSMTTFLMNLYFMSLQCLGLLILLIFLFQDNCQLIGVPKTNESS